MVGVSRLVAEHVATTRSASIPSAALAAARRSLLDAVGVSLAASGMEPACFAFRSIAKANGPGPCIAIGWGDRVGLLGASLCNGALAHAIDFEDVLDESPIHPNACAVAAALAVAETRDDVDGDDLLAAIAVGSDLVCRLALALDEDPGGRGWYLPPILGAYGATAAASRLLRLPPAQTLDALSLTLAQVTCTSEFRATEGSSLRAIRDGFATHAGVLASLLAAGGVSGFEAPIEGGAGLYALYSNGAFDEHALVGDIGDSFRGADVSYKPWPACRGTHAFIEAALAIRRDSGDREHQIERIEAEGTGFLEFLFHPTDRKAAPRTPIEAKFSAPFAIALALERGWPSLEDFTVEGLGDPSVIDLAGRVHFQAVGEGYRNANGGALTVTFKDGTSQRHVVRSAAGHPDNPISDAALEDKFRSCAARAAKPPRPDRIDLFIDTVARLGTDEEPIGWNLLGALHGDDDPAKANGR